MPDSRNVMERIRSGQLKKFSIYVEERLHRAAKTEASRRGISLQAFIGQILRDNVKPVPRREQC